MEAHPLSLELPKQEHIGHPTHNKDHPTTTIQSTGPATTCLTLDSRGQNQHPSYVSNHICSLNSDSLHIQCADPAPPVHRCTHTYSKTSTQNPESKPTSHTLAQPAQTSLLSMVESGLREAQHTNQGTAHPYTLTYQIIVHPDAV